MADDDQPTIISHEAPLPTEALPDSTHRILQGKVKPGDRLEHFELVRYIGGGGMGRVFCAVDTRLARTVALKILSVDQARDEETLLRFQNEAQSAARLDHDNIAQVFHVGEDRGLHYIVFEYVEGVNIRALVEQKGPLPLAEAISYSLQIAEALAHAAGREVVHRDIKPSNVLITPEGRVKLIDMGLARLRRVAKAEDDLTASGVTLGTFDYISPEQARDPRNADVRSDIYSLGCTLFYMLAGRPPFPEGTVLQKLLQHQGDRPPDIREYRPELPEEVTRVLRRMMAKDPRHRYRFPAELVDDLLLLAEHVGLQPIGPSGRFLVVHREPRISPLQRHLPWIAPIVTLICVVVLLEFFSRGADPVPPPQGPEAVVGGPSQPAGVTPTVTATTQKTPGGVDPAPPTGNGGSPHVTVTNPNPQRPPEPAPGPTPDPPSIAQPTNPLSALAGHDPSENGLEPPTIGGGLAIGPETTGLLSVVDNVDAPSSGISGAVLPPTRVGPAVDPSPTRTGPLVVTEAVSAENEFASLSAACSVAVDGDVIELHYDGRLDESPITLANLKVRIEAGENYRPVIVFRPDEDSAGPAKPTGSMFLLTDGRLEIANVALEFRVPADVPAESWSLFEVRRGQTVRLEECSLSIHNANGSQTTRHKDVAFFRARSSPGADPAPPDGGPTATPAVKLDLDDCIVRGEAALLRTADLQPVHLNWENGLLVTTGRFLTADGADAPAKPDDRIEIDLRDVTARMQGGFCRFDAGTPVTPHLLPAQIRCTNSILIGTAAAPLIEQHGVDGPVGLRQHIAYFGEEVFYQDFADFWHVGDLDGELLEQPKDFAGWKSHWGSEDEFLPRLDEVVWQELPEATRPCHAHTPADYTPTNGCNAGFRADRLPELPVP